MGRTRVTATRAHISIFMFVRTARQHQLKIEMAIFETTLTEAKNKPTSHGVASNETIKYGLYRVEPDQANMPLSLRLRTIQRDKEDTAFSPHGLVQLSTCSVVSLKTDHRVRT